MSTLFFNDPFSKVSIEIISFHNFVCFFLIIILINVLVLLIDCHVLWSNYSTNNIFSRNIFIESTNLEIIFTVIPILVLCLLVIPSINILICTNLFSSPQMNLTIMGHQWYWTYSYSNVYKSNISDSEAYTFTEVSFDSYMRAEDDLSMGEKRLLEVDNILMLPSKLYIQGLINSADVLHSWAIPALSLKIDACPGRINSLNFIVLSEKTFYGQCSEICGVNHGFMPIKLKTVTYPEFLYFLEEASKN